jgi:hypothetical protein
MIDFHTILFWFSGDFAPTLNFNCVLLFSIFSILAPRVHKSTQCSNKKNYKFARITYRVTDNPSLTGLVWALMLEDEKVKQR